MRLWKGSLLTAEHALRRVRSKLGSAVEVGKNTTLDGVHLALGEVARVVIGDWSHLSGLMLLSEMEIRIGSYVSIGWNAAALLQAIKKPGRSRSVTLEGRVPPGWR